MSVETLAAPKQVAAPSPAGGVAPAPKTPKRRGSVSLTARGEPLIWLTGGALAIALAMIFGLLAWIFTQGLSTFWPEPLTLVALDDGGRQLGEVTRHDRYRPADDVFAALPAEAASTARAAVEADAGWADRRLFRTGNFELTQTHFHWVDGFRVREETNPEWALVVERVENGRFYGEPAAFLIDGQAVAKGPEATWDKFGQHHADARRRWREIVSLQKHDLGELARNNKNALLARKQAELDGGKSSAAYAAADAEYERIRRAGQKAEGRITAEIKRLRAENERYKVRFTTYKGTAEVAAELAVADIVRAYPANQLGWWDKLSIYGSRWAEFVADDPREANTEGGVFPAIWGTVAMTLLMSLVVAPFGVLAALYLREYARHGPIVSAIRVAINNLAGVPSIVFGVFGLGFLCYGVGRYIDGGPRKAWGDEFVWTSSTWFTMLTVLAVTAVASFLLAIAGWRHARHHPSRFKKAARFSAVALWLGCTALFLALVVKTPYFDGFFRASLEEGNKSTYGTGGLLWASITLALLTLPVVIVATEEALASVPGSMREGSYACGASKWQTIRRIVLPRALPGIMTGMILSMARGAGEVAPLMLVGVMKVAPELPLDGVFPFVHPERSFMHLGFHVYDVGFQSQNSEAAKPLVYTTTVLLIGVIMALNVAAIWLRTRLRRRFTTGHF